MHRIFAQSSISQFAPLYKVLHTLARLLLFCSVSLSLAAQAREPLFVIDRTAGLSDSRIHCLLQAADGKIWIGTERGLNRFDGGSVTAIYAGNELLSNRVLSLCQSPDGMLWAGTDRGISRFGATGNADTVQIILPQQIGARALGIVCDAQQTVWVRSDKGLAQYSLQGTLLQMHYQGSYTSNGLPQERITSIATDDNANIWMGTAGAGLEFYNVRQKRFLHYGTLLGEVSGIVSPYISGLLFDKNGALWLSNTGGALSQIQLIESSGKSFEPHENRGSGCRLMPTDMHGNVWAYFIGSGLYYKEQTADSLSLFARQSQLQSPISCMIHSRSGLVLAGTERSGVYVYAHPASALFSPLRGMPDSWRLLCDGAANFVWLTRGQYAVRTSVSADNGRVASSVRGVQIRMPAIAVSAYSDASSRLWVLGQDSVLRVYRHEGKLVLEQRLPDAQALAFCGDDSDNFLFSQANRLYRCSNGVAKPGIGEATLIPFNPHTIIFSGKKYAFICDANTYIWDGKRDNFAEAGYLTALSPIFSAVRTSASEIIFGTLTGIYSLGAQADLELTQPSEAAKGKACYLLSAAGNQIIGCEDSALVSLRIGSSAMHRWEYDRFKIALSETEVSVIAKKSGALLIQTDRGIMSAFSQALTRQDAPPEWQLTVTDDRDESIKSSEAKGGAIYIKSNYDILELQFGELSLAYFGQPTVLVLPSGDSLVSPNGKYRLNAAQIGQGEQTFLIFPQGKPSFSATFSIHTPRGYAVLWWLMLAVCATAAIVFVLRQKHWMHAARRYMHGYRHDATVRELYQAKLNFFTEISHEIRTPLTMIIDPIDQIFKQEGLSNFTRDKLRIVLENTDKILSLVNGLLDYRKLETGSDTLLAEETDMGEAIELTVGRFRELAVQRGQDIILHIPQEEYLIWIDRNKFDKIFSSIMENILMNNPEGSTLGVWLREDTAKRRFRGAGRIAIEVSEISADNAGNAQSPQIEQFFTDTNASNPQSAPGLGLVIAKKLTELHKGELSVEPINKGYYRFKLVLNQGTGHLERHEMVLERLPLRAELYDRSETAFSDKKTILLVEDNDSVLLYLDTIFLKKYDVLKAANGREGLELAQAYIPDIIISDVMMPEMDGTEMCKRLKSNHTTAHIPIILLTAKTFTEDQVAGLEAGADDYIHKPFKSEILELKVKNILDSAERMRKQLKNDLISMPTEAFILSEEDKLIKKLIEYIDRNISDTEISVESLAAEMSISRAQLFRKTRAVLGQTPNELLKSMRLKKGEQLLRQGNLRISDVAFEVGFPNPQYFSQSFIKMYGMTPSAYQKKLNIDKGDEGENY